MEQNKIIKAKLKWLRIYVCKMSDVGVDGIQ